MSLFKYFKPEYYRCKRALKIINEAISIYKVNDLRRNRYLCVCFKKAYFSIYHECTSISKIQSIIPEFNCKYLTGRDRSDDTVWWPFTDTKSRLNALNKLRSLYKDKIAKL